MMSALGRISRPVCLLASFLWISHWAAAQTTPLQDTHAPSYPIDLPTTLRLAGAQNLDIQMARARLQEAEANRTSALEKFFPWIAPGINYHRRDGLAQAVPSGLISSAHFQSYSPGGTVGAQLEVGEAIYASLATKQLVKAAGEGLEGQRQDSLLSAARAYFDLTKARALVEVARQAVKTSEDYQQQLHVAVGLGTAFKGDELRIQTQTERYQIAWRQAWEQQRMAAVNLAEVLHLDSTVALVPQDNSLTLVTLFSTNSALESLVGRALESRPELKQSQAQMAAAHAAKNGSLYGPLIPALGGQVFVGGLGGGPDHGPNTFGAEEDYLLSATWRIGPGGLFDLGRIKASKARLATSELGDAKLRDAITAQVVTGLTRVQSLSDQIALAEKNLGTATETLRLTRERKQFGVGIVLEDLQAEQDLVRARSDYVSSIAEYNKAQYALQRAIGSLPPDSTAAH